MIFKFEERTEYSNMEGKLHHEDDPSLEHGVTKYWYLDGICYSADGLEVIGRDDYLVAAPPRRFRSGKSDHEMFLVKQAWFSQMGIKVSE